MDELVETSLRKAAVWDEVKDKLKESGNCPSRVASSSGSVSPGL
jgi:ABC-type phosphate transport system ATPase subunit